MKISPFLIASFLGGFIVASGAYSNAYTKIRRYPRHTCTTVGDVVEAQAAGIPTGGGIVCPHVTSEGFEAGEVHEVQVNTYFGNHPPGAGFRPFAKACALFQSIPDVNYISCGVSVSVPANASASSTQQLTFRYDWLDVNGLEPWHDNPTSYLYMFYSASVGTNSFLAGVKVVKD
ncbi:hypothetical protein WMF31_37085 [Sorangium sp. So ce1036]|uniref:hypothetical protein n=1 Tax=Sorangium sp. So ce1036 TaxID=3133328 RepID=UPI003F0DB1BE